MTINLNGIDYNVTSMIMYDCNLNVTEFYNIFNSHYEFVTSISCQNEIEFIFLFNDYLKQNK